MDLHNDWEPEIKTKEGWTVKLASSGRLAEEALRVM